MAAISIDVEGADALIRKFGRLEGRARQEVSRAVEATAFTVQNTARDEAPIDTGTLVRSIQIREVSDLTRDVFTNVPYAPRQNYGFFGTDSLGRTYNQPGFFFMDKGALEGERVFASRIISALKRAREAS